VFASLDVILRNDPKVLHFYTLAGWWFVGLVAFFLGVHLDPEVRK
jgi:hypothetical protein